MPRMKVVNGEYIELTAEEEAELDAMFEADDLDFGMVRAQRNATLGNCDWTQLDDAPLTDEQQEAWERYRQDLRDLPQTYSRVSEVVWPNDPPTQAAIDAAAE